MTSDIRKTEVFTNNTIINFVFLFLLVRCPNVALGHPTVYLTLKFIMFMSLSCFLVDIQVDFVDGIYTVSEGDGVVSVFLSKIGENEIPVMVSVVTETRDDTAIGKFSTV